MTLDETISALEGCTSTDPAMCLRCPFRKEPHCIQKMLDVSLAALKKARDILPKEPVDIGEGASYAVASPITVDD